MKPLSPGRILSSHLKKDREDGMDNCVLMKTLREQCLKTPVSVSVVRKITTHHGATIVEKPRQALRRVQHPRLGGVSSASQYCLSEIRA